MRIIGLGQEARVTLTETITAPDPIFVARERGEERPRTAIAARIKSEFEIFQYGRTEFY